MDAFLASAMVAPSGKTKVLLQFNRISKVLVGILAWTDPSTLNSEYFIYKEAEYDYETDSVQGDADNFEIVPIADLPQPVYESTMDVAVQAAITKQYPVVKQVNILARAIIKLSEAAGVAQDELVEMIDYINEIKRENDVRKEFYKNSPEFTFVSNEDVERQQELLMEGGLQEAYGGKVITGGTVF